MKTKSCTASSRSGALVGDIRPSTHCPLADSASAIDAETPTRAIIGPAAPTPSACSRATTDALNTASGTEAAN